MSSQDENQPMDVYVWGFSPSELQQWPADLNPIEISTWPPEDVVVVSDRSLETFQQAVSAHLLPTGRLPEAILYRTSGTPLAQDVWQYVDSQVEAEDWPTLRRLLSAPRWFEATEQAHEISISWLRHFEGRLETLTPEQVPVEADLQQTLKAHPAMWREFVHTLRERLMMRRRLLGPDPDLDSSLPPSEA